VPDNVVDFLLQTTIHTDSVASNEEKQRRKLTIEEVVGHFQRIPKGQSQFDNSEKLAT
jgi:hypothetical protein